MALHSKVLIFILFSVVCFSNADVNELLSSKLYDILEKIANIDGKIEKWEKDKDKFKVTVLSILEHRKEEMQKSFDVQNKHLERMQVDYEKLRDNITNKTVLAECHGKCFNNPCVHGKCYENPEGFICVYDNGYEGLLCDNSTDHCRSNPCVYGTCFSNRSSYTCSCMDGFTGADCDTAVATDCYDIYNKNVSQKSGVYSVTLWKSKQTIQVYCDMDTYPYGWTVFQKRFNGSVDFYRNFSEYTNGFGNLHGEFWLGLRFTEEMASQYESDLRLDVTAANNEHVYEQFENFSLSAYPDFTLHLGRQTVKQIQNKKIRFRFSTSNGYRFSTFDHDKDSHSANCAEITHGGWWYWHCVNANLNGEYLSPPGAISSYGGGGGGFVYFSWKGHATLKSSQVMFRKHTG